MNTWTIVWILFCISIVIDMALIWAARYDRQITVYETEEDWQLDRNPKHLVAPHIAFFGWEKLPRLRGVENEEKWHFTMHCPYRVGRWRPFQWDRSIYDDNRYMRIFQEKFPPTVFNGVMISF